MSRLEPADADQVDSMRKLPLAPPAIRAGFSRKGAKTAGSRLLANVHVRAKIDTLVEAQLEKVDMDLEEIVKTASRIGRATVDQLFSPDNGSWTLLHPTELPADGPGSATEPTTYEDRGRK